MNRALDPRWLAAPTSVAAGARVGVSRPHESAHMHVAGNAPYVDDLPELAGTLHAALGLSPVAHGTLIPALVFISADATTRVMRHCHCSSGVWARSTRSTRIRLDMDWWASARTTMRPASRTKA